MKNNEAVSRKPLSKKGFVEPPIKIDKPEPRKLEKGEYMAMKIRSDPNDVDSLSSELHVPFFSTGTPEEWFKFLKDLKSVFQGQNLTTGPNQYRTVRLLLKDDALRHFNNKATELGAETTAHLKQCIGEVTQWVLPKKALQTQRRYMRRVCRKPRDTSMKDYIARYNELNGYLAMFNDNGDANKIADDEVMEHMEFAIPHSWQKQMILQGFNVIDSTIDEFIEFCERLEMTDDTPDKNNDAKKQSKKRKDSDGTSTKKSKPQGKNKFLCELCGWNPTHNTSDCRTIKKKIQEAKEDFRKHKSGYKPNSDKKVSWKRRSNPNEEELHTFIKDEIKSSMQSAMKELMKGKSQNVSDEQFNYDLREKLTINIDSDEESKSE